MVHEQRVVAIAADYADALLVARRWQRLLILFLVVVVLAQLAVFFTAHFAPGVLNGAAVTASTRPGVAGQPTPDFFHYLTAATLFAGMIAAILLTLTLFLTIHIMLVGRLIGVRDVTRALVLSFVLLFLLLPWQTLLVTQDLGRNDFVWTGILCTWREIVAKVLHRGDADVAHQVIYWIRFVGAPVVGLIFLLLVQVRSGRGLKYALGEEEIVPAGDVIVDDRR